MKKISIVLMCLVLMINLLQCSGVQKPDPKIALCKTTCDTTSDKCIKKAFKNEAKKAACETVKIKCYSDCEKK